MREMGSAAYWAITGAVLSFGGLGAFTIGLPFIVVGLVMAFVGLMKLWTWGVWAITVGLGAVPAYVILRDVLEALGSSAPPCTQEGSSTIAPPSGADKSGVVSCSPPIPEDFVAVVMFFAVIMHSGPAVRLFMLARGRLA
jgi:hypothetical protein